MRVLRVKVQDGKLASRPAHQELEKAVWAPPALGHQRADVSARIAVNVLRNQIGQQLGQLLVQKQPVHIGAGIFWS
jgi:hypothetical protein